MPTKGNSRSGCGRLYDVNGEKLYVYRYPDLSFTPEGLGLFIVFLLGFLILDFFNLNIGGIASEEQLRMGIYAPIESRTGPNKDYYAESIELVKKEVHKRDSRIKKDDIIFVEWHPENMSFAYELSPQQKAGYIGDGRFRICINYFVNTGNGINNVFATAIVRLHQEKAFIFMVKQIWIFEEYKTTYRYGQTKY